MAHSGNIPVQDVYEEKKKQCHQEGRASENFHNSIHDVGSRNAT